MGFLESIKEKLFAKRRSSQQLGSEEIVAMHKVRRPSGGSPRGSLPSSPTTNPDHPPLPATDNNASPPTTPSTQFGNSTDEAMKALIENYSNNISKINAKNLRKYMAA